MNVELLNCSPLANVVLGARTCYESYDKSNDESDKKLIHYLIEKKHTSVLEHCWFSFKIKGISRLCLQEIVRHRLSSFSVKSTRYTLNRDIKNKEIIELFVSSGDPRVDLVIKETLEKLFVLKKEFKIKNDVLKYALPEAFKTELVWSVNARSLRNFLQLRLSKSAHFEIRELARKIISVLPKSYHILFEDVLCQGKQEK